MNTKAQPSRPMSYWREVADSCATFAQLVDKLERDGIKRGRAIILATQIAPQKYSYAMTAGEGNWERE